MPRCFSLSDLLSLDQRAVCKAQGALSVLARHKNAHQPLAGDNGANAHAAALQRGNDLFLICAVRQRAPERV